MIGVLKWKLSGPSFSWCAGSLGVKLKKALRSRLARLKRPNQGQDRQWSRPSMVKCKAEFWPLLVRGCNPWLFSRGYPMPRPLSARTGTTNLFYLWMYFWRPVTFDDDTREERGACSVVFCLVIIVGRVTWSGLCIHKDPWHAWLLCYSYYLHHLVIPPACQ